MVLINRVRRQHLLRIATAAVLLILLLTLLACGPGDSATNDPAVEQAAIRPPHPTFTPTPQGAVAAPSPPPTVAGDAATTAIDQPAPAAAAPPPAEAAKAKLVINTDFVNLREGPGTDATIITMLQLGQEFDIIGKNASGDWWFVCCSQDKAGWVTGEFSDVSGPLDQVPVVADDAAAPLVTQPAVVEVSPPTATPQTVAVAEPPTATPPPAPLAAAPAEPEPTTSAQGGPVTTAASTFEFELVAQEQFPETNVVRVFLYVFDGKGALAGYGLRVVKDGAELPVEGVSFGPNSAFTWPVADPRQRAQNFKGEFPNQNPAGVWEVQLMRDGVPVGPPASFTLVAGDQNRELYVRYSRP
jgi:uncharacterized protein YraI